MNAKSRLGEIVSRIPAASKIFHSYGLDFCCGGNRTLEEACSERGLDAVAMLSEITSARSQDSGDIRWLDQPLERLIDHIIERFHTPLKKELPGLVELAKKVETVHADKPDRPVGLADHLGEIQEAVTIHLAKEEKILFPLIKAGQGSTAYMPINMMIQEHEDHNRNLKRTRELTDDFHIPEHACASWRELYRALEQLEIDLMEHIHLENNILFPRALNY